DHSEDRRPRQARADGKQCQKKKQLPPVFCEWHRAHRHRDQDQAEADQKRLAQSFHGATDGAALHERTNNAAVSIKIDNLFVEDELAIYVLKFAVVILTDEQTHLAFKTDDTKGLI